MIASQQRPEQTQQTQSTQQAPQQAGVAAGPDVENSFALEQAGLAGGGQDLIYFEEMLNASLFEADKALIPTRDIVYEQIAHGFAYEDKARDPSGGPDAPITLAELGYQEVDRFSDPDTDLQFIALMPCESEWLRQRSLPKPEVGVMAFRGTSSAKDLLDDVNPAGVGYAQFEANQDRIAQAMGTLGRCDVTGHSLGGALAQLAACRIGGVREIVTFQAPGISQADVDKLDESVQSTHYRRKGDLVDNAGTAHTEGEVVEIGSDRTQTDLPQGHRDYLLDGVGEERGIEDLHGTGMALGSIERGSTEEMDDQRYEDTRRIAGETKQRASDFLDALADALADGFITPLERLKLDWLLVKLGIDLIRLTMELAKQLADKIDEQVLSDEGNLDKQIEGMRDDVDDALRSVLNAYDGLGPYTSILIQELSPATFLALQLAAAAIRKHLDQAA